MSEAPAGQTGNMTVNRRTNAIALFHAFVEENVQRGIEPRGLAAAFAERIQVSASLWSQIKSSRPIGDKLARQIEAASGKPALWLDQARAPAGMTQAEQQMVARALKAWRTTNVDGRKRINALLLELGGKS